MVVCNFLYCYHFIIDEFTIYAERCYIHMNFRSLCITKNEAWSIIYRIYSNSIKLEIIETFRQKI